MGDGPPPEPPAQAAEGSDRVGEIRIGRRVFVGNLSWAVSWQTLKDHFKASGCVVYANIMRDENQRSKGWGIVEFETPEEALRAVTELNGTELAGRRLVVREDREDRDVRAYNRAHGIAQPRKPRRDPTLGRPGEEGGPERTSSDSAAAGAGESGAAPGPAAGTAPGTAPGSASGRGRALRSRPEQKRVPTEPSGYQVVVQGLPWKYTDSDLSGLFEYLGVVESAKIVIGRDGRSQGYGTVRFAERAAATAAIEEMDKTPVEGRALTVKLDRYEQPPAAAAAAAPEQPASSSSTGAGPKPGPAPGTAPGPAPGPGPAAAAAAAGAEREPAAAGPGPEPSPAPEPRRTIPLVVATASEGRREEGAQAEAAVDAARDEPATPAEGSGAGVEAREGGAGAPP